MFQSQVNLGKGGEINTLLFSFPINMLNFKKFPKTYVTIMEFYDAPLACINIPLS